MGFVKKEKNYRKERGSIPCTEEEEECTGHDDGADGGSDVDFNDADGWYGGVPIIRNNQNRITSLLTRLFFIIVETSLSLNVSFNAIIVN